MLVRLSHSLIRFGTFQRLAFFEQSDNMDALVDYCCRHFYPDCKNAQDLFKAVLRASADTVASWMAAGFVHGVMNTDNMSITGESFDYGPYRFLPTLKSSHTAAYFDHNGLYAFGRQPESMYWNVAQLAQSLSLITDDKPLIEAMDGFAEHYRARLCHHVFRRLGLAPTSLEADTAFVLATFNHLEASQTPWPQFWHDWQGGADQKARAQKSPNAKFYTGAAFEDWYKLLASFDANGSAATRDHPPSLLYEEIGALWEPIDECDDWSSFHDKVMSFRRVSSSMVAP